MPNTIDLRLLDNRNIIAELNGIPLAQENSYKIIAGEVNATQFKIASKPTQYENATYTVEMVNSQGYGIEETNIIDDSFDLPTGMAVAGYGIIQIRAYQGEEEVPFMPLKVKVWNTLPDWKDHISDKSIITQTTGYGSSLVMSQRAVTKELEDIREELREATIVYVRTLAPQVQKNTNKIRAVENALIQAGTISKQNGLITLETQQTGGTRLQDLTILDGSYATVNKISGNTVVYEQTLKQAKLSGIKSVGRNLFNQELLTTAGWTKTTYKGESCFAFSGGVNKTTMECYIPAGKKLTFSFKKAHERYIDFYIRLIYVDGTYYDCFKRSYDEISVDFNQIEHTTFYAMQKDVIGVQFHSYTGTIYLKDIMFNIGDTALLFELYTESIMSLPKTIGLGKWDYIENGQIVRQTETLTFDGSENWFMSDTATTELRVGLSLTDLAKVVDFDKIGDIVCNYYEAVSAATTYFNNTGISIHTTSDFSQLFIYDENFNTNAILLWKEHLAELSANKTPLMLAYKKETPTYEPITFENQYLVWNKGIEAILGNDNAQFGANVIIKNEYIILLGGTK